MHQDAPCPASDLNGWKGLNILTDGQALPSPKYEGPHLMGKVYGKVNEQSLEFQSQLSLTLYNFDLSFGY